MAKISNLKDISNRLTQIKSLPKSINDWLEEKNGLSESLDGLRGRCQQLTKSAMELLFPMQCLGCGREATALCDTCMAALPRLKPPYCEKCSQPDVTGVCHWCSESPLLTDGIHSVCLLEGVARESVHSLKYRNVRTLAPYLGRLLAEHLEAHPLPTEVIVPVPLHPKRLRDRGYNQAGLLAQELSKLTGIPLDEEMLVRSKNSPSQVRSATREQRQSNVEDGFHALGDPNGKGVLLIDDVATTGSTLSACAGALKQAGARSVWGLTLAKEP
ncbi:MAG: ComF family protein [Dehalococcoidia bacterium]